MNDVLEELKRQAFETASRLTQRLRVTRHVVVVTGVKGLKKRHSKLSIP
jgi:hypothetical protein